MSWITPRRSREPTVDGIPIPKTYSTRTGALQLYVGPDDVDDDDDDEKEEDQGLELKPKYVPVRRPFGQELIDLSLKLGTIERLAKCVLNFGDQDYDHEHTSISDAKNKIFLKFLRSVDDNEVKATDVDVHAQPGGDLNKYLRDLKSSASNRYSEDGRMYVTKSRESMELQALLRRLDSNSWPSPYGQDGASDRQSTGYYTRPMSQVSFANPSPRPSSTSRSTYQVLSAKKVAASIKYGNYLGRPLSKLSADDDNKHDTDYSSLQYVTSANVTRKEWTPTEATDESQLDTRGKFYGGAGEEDWDSDDSKKRRRFRERTYLTGFDELYQVEEVNDENISEIKSEKSAKKLRSKKSLSGAMGDDEDTTSSGSHVLPQLLSDRLLEMSEKDAHSIIAELDALNLRKPVDKKKGKKDASRHTYTPLPPAPRTKLPTENVKIPDHIAEALQRHPTASIQQLERELEKRGFLKDGQVTELVNEKLSGANLRVNGEGFTEEELELAKRILQKKLAKAQGKLDEKEIKSTSGKKKGGSNKSEKKGKRKKLAAPKDDRSQEDIERDAMTEKHENEKRKRDLEVAELQRKIAEKRDLLQQQEDMTSAKSKEIREKMEQLEREAEDLQRAEDEARSILADVRKKQREEREAKRKADQDKKKLEAVERREREKKELEEKKKKELALSEIIADAEMRRRIREEEEQKMFEEERLAQERYEDELRKAQEEEEAEEERLIEMERQAEEEAMQRLTEEREATERNRRKLMEKEEAMREMERLRMEKIEEEQQKLEDERQKMKEWEDAKREAERERLQELRRLEEEARAKMMEDIESRRTDALVRRDLNMESRQNVDKLRHGQGITKAWTFSYFVHWDRAKYERRIGTADPRKVVKIKNPPPKKPVEVKPETDQANIQS